MLCNCPATDSFARSLLSFYSQSAVSSQAPAGEWTTLALADAGARLEDDQDV